MHWSSSVRVSWGWDSRGKPKNKHLLETVISHTISVESKRKNILQWSNMPCWKIHYPSLMFLLKLPWLEWISQLATFDDTRGYVKRPSRSHLGFASRIAFWHAGWFPNLLVGYFAHIWGVPEMGPNGWSIMENPIKVDDLGVALFQETPIIPISKRDGNQLQDVLFYVYRY